ncbi:MAG TPA: hypothetical protein VE958_01400 [Bryobacteraceae bacterium]|jgi:hypothetical protein|nr:hypothetical protein [Bryobacteraceae bacterium]
MSHRIFAVTSTLAAAVALLSLGASGIAGQAPAPTPNKTSASTTPYVPPKTPWGDPDLQGHWPTTGMIPLQKALPGSAGRGGKGKGKQQAPPAPNARPRPASMVVDPPDGRLPPLTAEAVKRRAEANGGKGFPAEWKGFADSPEDVNIYIRCITRGILGSIMPSSYNNGNQIIQAPGYVIIRHEMIHETRIIPLDGRPHVGKDIKMYMGDSRGHWEGNTLVVETTNMTDKTSVGSNGTGYNGEGGRHSEALKLTERFTRVAEDLIQYQAVIDDPLTWTRPYTVEIPLELDRNYGFFEYACHEGNYALDDILSGARYEEEKKAGN